MIEEEILKKYGSPVYVYEEEKLIKNVNKLLNFAEKSKLKTGINVKMHYSTKANANLSLLKIINKLGMSVDSMSPIELELTEEAGFKKEDILYVCNNISQDEMKYIANKDILICLDSVSQVEMFGKVCSNKDIMIRINPEEEGIGHCKKVVTSGKEARFGILEKDFNELFETTKKYNLNIVGIHQHLGSSFFNNNLEKYILGVKSGLEIIDRNFKDINIIDLGGGFGVPYEESEEELDFNLLISKLEPVLNEFLNKNKNIQEVKFEPGRYVVCDSSYILGTVNSLKETYNTKWIGTDIGMNILVRPSMYNSYHKIEIIKKESTDEYITANIAGNVCESSDILGKNRKVLKPKINDIVKVYNTGAYGYSMSSDYTGRLTTAEVLIAENGKIELIRKKRDIKDIINLF